MGVVESGQDAVLECGRDDEPGNMKNHTIVDDETISVLPIVPQGCRKHLPVRGKSGDECVAELAVSFILGCSFTDLNDRVMELT